MLTAEITNDAMVGEFIFNLKIRGAIVVEVSDMDELIMLYHKSGGGMEGIINTVQDIGSVSAENNTLAYQAWVKGEWAVAEGGEVCLAEDAPAFYCEHLIVVLDAENIIHINDGSGIRKGRYLFAETLKETVYRPISVAVYIINKNYKRTEYRAVCGPDCRC